MNQVVVAGVSRNRRQFDDKVETTMTVARNSSKNDVVNNTDTSMPSSNNEVTKPSISITTTTTEEKAEEGARERVDDSKPTENTFLIQTSTIDTNVVDANAETKAEIEISAHNQTDSDTDGADNDEGESENNNDGDHATISSESKKEINDKLAQTMGMDRKRIRR
jgi:hypothetical protein